MDLDKMVEKYLSTLQEDVFCWYLKLNQIPVYAGSSQSKSQVNLPIKPNIHPELSPPYKDI
jgi:hypothetical protein